MVRGADSLMARWKKGRSEYTSVIDTIDAVIPVYSTDKKETGYWYGQLKLTQGDGKKDTVSVMETWVLYKDGKADLLFQFDRHARKK
jgi:hypothetical protein